MTRDLHCPEGFELSLPFEDGGAFFRVFRVARGGELLVCKRPSARFSSDPGARGVLENEARALERLDGEGAPRLVVLGVDGRGPYLVMTLARGEPLLALALGAAPPFGVAHRAFEALARVHDRGVVHGDPSPSNLLVDGDAVTFIDFGLAALRSPPDPARASEPSPAPAGRFRGTLLYAAPEVARGASATDASDVFALGATLFHVLTGEPPRRATSAAAMLLEAAEEPIDGAPLEALGAGLGRALDPRAEARPSARELAVAVSLLRDPRLRGSRAQ